MIAQSYGTVADLFGKPVFEWVERRENEKIAAWLDDDPCEWYGPTPDSHNHDPGEYQESLKDMRARKKSERMARKLPTNGHRPEG